MSENPKVFISYAHKDQPYEDKVLEFANHLRAEGIDAMIDQYEEAPAEGWPRWMERQITESEYVLVLCDETYHRKLYSEEKGKGVLWEASIIYQLLYDAKTETKKFIACFFDDSDQQYIPLPLKSFTFYIVSDGEQYEKLYWRLRGVQNAKKPPLGELRPLPTKERKTMFISSPIDTEKWNAAKWRGVAYPWWGDAPAIGIIFANFAAGKDIVYEWKNKFNGLETADDFIDVSYVIPPFPKDCWIHSDPERNFGKGYFLHIGSNIDASIQRASGAGLMRSEMLLATISRYQWMDERNGSTNRDGFIQAYKKAGKYYLVPVGFSKKSGVVLPEDLMYDVDCAIPMKRLTVVSGNDINEESPLKAVLLKPEGM